MSFRNATMAEFSIPRTQEVRDRLHNFYKSIGWLVRQDTEEPHFFYVHPTRSMRAVGYWLTENETKLARFVVQEEPNPSKYAVGLRRPSLENSVEVSFVMSSDGAVHRLYKKGGALLESHCHQLLQMHNGAQEFRFADPFNYSLRVNANPNYQIRPR